MLDFDWISLPTALRIGRAAGEHRRAGLVELLDADLRAQERLLRERGERGLAHLRIVEGLVQVVEARHVLAAAPGL